LNIRSDEVAAAAAAESRQDALLTNVVQRMIVCGFDRYRFKPRAVYVVVQT